MPECHHHRVVADKILRDASYWRYRAEEMRTLADAMRYPEPKRIMLGAAKSYDQLAEWADQRDADDLKRR
jgi:hypothetical protein